MQDRNNIQNNKNQTQQGQKDKSNVDQKSRTPGQSDRDQKHSDNR